MFSIDQIYIDGAFVTLTTVRRFDLHLLIEQ